MASAQVSPGPLALPHAKLDAAMQCFNCHPRPGARETMEDRCIACHQEIGALRTAQRGLHAHVTDRKCASCHPEHAGRDFHLVAWEVGGPTAFDHGRAGWPLEGGHQKIECRNCHRPELQVSTIMSKLKVSDRKETWLALETRCASCHEDEHRGQLGEDCAKCHTSTAWKPASVFDHAATGYPLTGKHLDVKCAKCHAAEGDAAAPRALGRAGLVSAHAADTVVTTTRFKPVAHVECSNCHRDPHAGAFGAACAKCHTTTDFHTIPASAFNHDLTRYPLRGRHVSVACATCHDPKRAWGNRPEFKTCDACHKDAHAGQATLAGQKTDCASCHSVEGFRPSTFTVALHQTSAYPLAGAHASAACEKCHARGADTVERLGVARVALRPTHGACTDCHGDPHQGRLTKATGGREPTCLDCHDTRRFAPSSVDLVVHQRFDFHLEAAHRAVPCQACHAELRAAKPASTLRSTRGRPLTFREPKARCVDCHSTPHGAQFDRNRKSGTCETCHGLEAFKPASRFDHNRDASFRLDGAHAPVACALCHRTETGPKGSRVIWKPVSSRCESCHTREETTPAKTLKKPVATPSKPEAKREQAEAAKREQAETAKREAEAAKREAAAAKREAAETAKLAAAAAKLEAAAAKLEAAAAKREAATTVKLAAAEATKLPAAEAAKLAAAEATKLAAAEATKLAAAEATKLAAAEATKLAAAAAKLASDTLPKPAAKPDAKSPVAVAADTARSGPAGSGREAAPSPASLGDQAHASVSQVCGEVRDGAGRPIAGAQVSIADLGQATATDERGHFCISAPAGRHEVSVRAIGFEPMRRTVKVAGTVEEAIVLKAVPVVADFALNSKLFRTGGGTETEWPVDVRKLVERARRSSDRAAAQRSAGQFDQAADDWGQVLARAGDGLPAMEARYHAVRSRYLAWRLDPTHHRAQSGLEELTSFLARAPLGAARDSAARWADRLKP